MNDIISKRKLEQQNIHKGTQKLFKERKTENKFSRNWQKLNTTKKKITKKSIFVT